MCPVSHITVEDEVNYLRRRAKSLGYKLVAVEAKSTRFEKETFVKYPNHMKKWLPGEHEQLVNEFNTGLELEDMMTLHQRTAGGIISRLSGAYLIEYNYGGYVRRANKTVFINYKKYLKLRNVKP